MSKWQVGCKWFLLLLLSCPSVVAQEVLQRDVLTTPPPGGVVVDARGAVTIDARSISTRRQKRAHKLVAVSLGKIDLIVRRRGLKRTDQLPLEMRQLGRLANIKHVYVALDDQQQVVDIVLLGPIGDSNLPPLSLDDFLDAWRTRDQRSTCSIEPTAVGEQLLAKLLKAEKRFHKDLPRKMVKALGDQEIKFASVRATSRLARVMLGADIRLKQLAMGLVPSRVRGLPSYPQLLRSSIAPRQPRWWITCQNPVLVCNEQKTFWTIPRLALSVSASTHAEAARDEVQRWADAMTEHYQRVEAKHAPLFLLRPIFHCKLASTLLGQVEASFSVKLQRQFSGLMRLRCTKYEPPKTIATQVTSARVRGRTVVTASGGVVIPKWDLQRMEIGYINDIPDGLYQNEFWIWPITRLPKRIESSQSCTLYHQSAESTHTYKLVKTTRKERCCICILVDVSFSMSTIRNVVLRALSKQLDELESGTPLIVGAFDTEVRFGFRGRVDESDDWKLKPMRFIAAQRFEQDTDLVRALATANHFAPTSIVLISDGTPNRHSAHAMLNYVRQNHQIPISTVCLSSHRSARVTMGVVSLLTHGRIIPFESETE